MKQSAGIILFDVTKTPVRVLCLRAYANWDFPKGQLDPGETHLEAAIRELEEETGYNSSDIQIIAKLKHLPEVITYGSGKKAKTATYFYATLVNLNKEPYLPISPKLGRPEHDEWRWVPTTDLRDLLPKRLQPIVEKLSAKTQNSH